MVVRPRGRTHEGVRLVHLLDDPYRAVLPAGHPLTAKRVLDLTGLADEPRVRGDGPGPCLDPVIEGCAAAGFSPHFVARNRSG
nr:LysR substrate-binding domain-containing protein [Streptomyces chryseus]